MNIAIIIVTKDRPADIERCLRSIEQQTLTSQHIIVVDGSRTLPWQGSTAPVEHIIADPGITKQRNIGRLHLAADQYYVVW